MNHTCAQVDCIEPATKIVIESHALAMLFRSGAGLVCAHHADQYERIGGVVIDGVWLGRTITDLEQRGLDSFR